MRASGIPKALIRNTVPSEPRAKHHVDPIRSHPGILARLVAARPVSVADHAARRGQACRREPARMGVARSRRLPVSAHRADRAARPAARQTDRRVGPHRMAGRGRAGRTTPVPRPCDGRGTRRLQRRARACAARRRTVARAAASARRQLQLRERERGRDQRADLCALCAWRDRAGHRRLEILYRRLQARIHARIE